MKKLAAKVFNKYILVKRKFSKTQYLSLGENCLTDNILSRHNLKSFSTPYSHGRSNLDYAINLEQDHYQNLLKQDYLHFNFINNERVVRNNFYNKCDDIYYNLHLNGFEFTHHNVIENESQRKSYERKISRMQSFAKSKKLKFLYHYRNNENKNIKLLIEKAEKFLSYYQEKSIDCELIFFTQEIITTPDERSIIKIHDSNNTKGFVLKTLETWAGEDQDVFWAIKDDDLILKMINEIK